MSIEIRLVQEEETPAFLDVISATSLERLDPDVVAAGVRRLWDYARVWGAWDGERFVGTLRSWGSELTVPGCGRLPASAVTTVGVRPSHRRQGILTELMATEHAAARERGESVAMLYPSEYPIYGRFGYGPATTLATWTLTTPETGFVAPPTGSIEQLTPTFEARDAIKEVFEAWRLRHPGEMRRRDALWDFDLGLVEEFWGPRWNGFLALHRDEDGRVDGYVRYKTENKSERRQPRGIVTVEELHALDADAYSALWQYLAGIDLTTTVTAGHRLPAEGLPWLLRNARAAELSGVGDGLWVKLLDLPRALTARSYEREGAVVIEAIDAGGTPEEVRTRLALDASHSGAICTITDRSPDLTVDASALGAAYLGGTRLHDAVAVRGADEHQAGALATADALFATLESPWCSTEF